jgi:hypothetical protein
VEFVFQAADFYMNRFAIFSHRDVFFLTKTHVAGSLVGTVKVSYLSNDFAVTYLIIAV